MNIADHTATQAETYLQNISLDNIQKIEILKSPQGSVHGGQAAGGVIAITTDEGIFNGKKIRQKIKFGSNNSIYSGTYYSNGQKNVKMSISANISHSDGISSGNKNGLNTEKDAYNEGSITFKSTLKNERGSLAPHRLGRLDRHRLRPHHLHQDVHPVPSSWQATCHLRHTGGRGGTIVFLNFAFFRFFS